MTIVEFHYLHEIRDDLQDARSTYGRGSSQAQETFERLVRAAAAAGTPLDALRVNSPVEAERFFASTVPGPEGHVYWSGGKTFRINGETPSGFAARVGPRRWWWAHVHPENGPLLRTQDVVPVCGDANCINPEHCVQDRATARLRWPAEKCITILQVTAARLGRTPTSREWGDVLRLQPSAQIIRTRLGPWHVAVAKAGLRMPPGAWREFTDAECLTVIRTIRDEQGSWPTLRQYRAYRARQAEPLDTPAASTLQRHFGSWQATLDRAKRAH